MTLKNDSDIFEAIDVTWPAEKFLEIPKWRLRRSVNGGKRVSAATAIGAPDFSDIKLAENKMAQWHQDKLFMIKKNEIILDEALSQSGYHVIDPTNIWCISSKTLSIELIGPQGTPTFSSISTHSLEVLVIVTSSIS